MKRLISCVLCLLLVLPFVGCKEEYQKFIDEIVWDNNNYRPSFALQYKNPIEYRTQLGFK